MGKAATLTIYRALLRVARRWEAELGGFVDLRMPLVTDGWERHLNGWSKSGAGEAPYTLLATRDTKS
jgi:hypothetical protein